MSAQKFIAIAVGVAAGTGTWLALATDTEPAPKPTASAVQRIEEDDPRFRCATMGDHTCGPNASPTVLQDVPAHCYSVQVPGPNPKAVPVVNLWLQGNGEFCEA